MKLFDIAHSRTGDKGNTSIISVIPYQGEDYALIKAKLSAEMVQDYLRKTINPSKVTRYELKNIPAFIFVLEGALGGGVTHSVSLDRHGKTLSSLLLEIEL